MKKLILFLILIIFLSGCSIFNLNDFVLPNDIEFINTIKTLDTPEKICDYMRENFTYKENLYYTPNPYQMWLDKKGDCNDYATFAVFIANYYGYETYQIRIFWLGLNYSHYLAVYKENGTYTYSSNESYFSKGYDTFLDIVKDQTNGWSKYIVYDYNMNLIEQK